MLPADLCTIIRNGTRSRLRQVPLSYSTQNLAILGILLRHGFLSSLSLGSHNLPASPEGFKKAPTAARRIWAELKYRNERPVIKDIQLVSKPSKHVYVNPQELAMLLRGQTARFIEPLNLGEIAILSEQKDGKPNSAHWWDGREAVMRGISGELVMRVTPE